MNRIAIIVAVTLALVGAAHAFGIGREGSGFGRLGAMGKAKTTAITSCSGTGLNFTVACNSQYIGVL